jgi:hypothetical protein
LSLPEPPFVEIERRSVAMLSPGQWALHREEALRLYGRLGEALSEVRRLQQLLEEVTRRG